MRALPILLMATAVLAGCEKQVQAPTGTGLCWHLATAADGRGRFNLLASGQPNIEQCAARLDEMRIRFLGLGSQQHDVVGAYQGQFLFVGPAGASIAPTLDGYRYLMMVHSGDGRLVKPGAMPVQ